MKDHPDLDELVARLPDGISSAKLGEPAGVFICRRVPVLTKAADDTEAEWTIEPGEIEWSLRTDGVVERALLTVDSAITAESNTSAVSFSNRSKLHASLREFERDETKRLRKKTQLPMDAPTPKTICWMEVR